MYTIEDFAVVTPKPAPEPSILVSARTENGQKLSDPKELSGYR
jgi:hypothetical protein